MLGQQRGRRRVWRKPIQKYDKTVVRPRWKSASMFMFWACFTWDKKGPYYCFPAETVADRKRAERMIEQLNQAIEPDLRLNWELETKMRRLGLRNKAGKTSTWKFTKTQGRLIRDNKEGIDWWRYRNEILQPLLFPFAKRCLQDRPNTIVLEDGTPAHRHHANQRLYNLHGIQKLAWIDNSPDLNAIEPAWGHLKRATCSRGPPKTAAELRKRWASEWRALQQSKLQQWILRIKDAIPKVILLQGDNAYHEGKEGEAARQERSQRYQRDRVCFLAKKQAKSEGKLDQFEAKKTQRWLEERFDDNEDAWEDVN